MDFINYIVLGCFSVALNINQNRQCTTSIWQQQYILYLILKNMHILKVLNTGEDVEKLDLTFL